MSDPLKDQREFENEKALAGNNYTPEIIDDLVRKFDIKIHSQIASMQENLNFAAWVYIQQKEENWKMDTRSIRAEILNIQKASDELKDKLATLTQPANELFWLPQHQLVANLFFIKGDASPFGHTIVRHQFDSGARSTAVLREDQICESVTIISNLARYALVKIKPDKGGRPSDGLLNQSNATHKFRMSIPPYPVELLSIFVPVPPMQKTPSSVIRKRVKEVLPVF